MKKANRRSEVLFLAILSLIFCFFPSIGADQTTVSRLPRSHSMDELYPRKVIDFLNSSVHEERVKLYATCNKEFTRSTELTDAQEAYKVRKNAICGGGYTKYSKLFMKILDLNIEAYCTSDDIAYLSNTKNYFDFVNRYAVLKEFYGMGITLIILADKEKDVNKISRLKKEALFWLRLEEGEYPDVENDIVRIEWWLEHRR